MQRNELIPIDSESADTAEIRENQGETNDFSSQAPKAAMGFEPMNNGFAIRPLGPLGYAAETSVWASPGGLVAIIRTVIQAAAADAR